MPECRLTPQMELRHPSRQRSKDQYITRDIDAVRCDHATGAVPSAYHNHYTILGNPSQPPFSKGRNNTPLWQRGARGDFFIRGKNALNVFALTSDVILLILSKNYSSCYNPPCVSSPTSTSIPTAPAPRAGHGSSLGPQCPLRSSIFRECKMDG